MKVAIDISQIPYGTGVATYTRNLVQNLLTIDNKNQYLFYANVWRRKDDIVEFLNGLEGEFEHKLLPIPPTISAKIFNSSMRLSIDRLIGRSDILHTSDWTEPSSAAVKITTIHDLIPLLFPEISDERLVKVHKKKFELVQKESKVIIVPSETTKKDLMKLNIKGNRIRVVPEAPDQIFKPLQPEKIAEVKQKYDLKKEYFFSVGITKRKNTQILIDAFQDLQLDNIELVLTGHPYTEINFQKNVRLLGHVDWDDMPALYSGAQVFVYPSIYEGFGLPILESFACGTPVVTSNVGSMREIAEGAAVLVDPRQQSEIADAILLAVEKRNKLTVLGRQRVKRYTWEQTARDTLNIYEEAHNEAGN